MYKLYMYKKSSFFFIHRILLILRIRILKEIINRNFILRKKLK